MEDERLKNNFVTYKVFMEKMEEITDSINELKISIAELPEKIFEKADDRYASKITERGFYALVGALSLGVIYLIINSLIK